MTKPTYTEAMATARRVSELEQHLCGLECDLIWAQREIAERDATIARLHDLVAKFQRGGTSTLYAEGHTDG